MAIISSESLTNAENKSKYPNMSEENIKTVRLMESYTTYESHGDIKLNLNIFPELNGKSNSEIQDWLDQNFHNLYIHCGSCELRKDQNYVYTEEELEDYKADNEEPELFEDSDVIELCEYWNSTEVVWDKIKGEEKTMHIVD